MTETVLVTGGTGYVGGWCIALLLQRGHAVRTTVRSLSRESGVRAAVAKIVDPADRLAFFAADLTSDAGWDAAMAGVDYVLHVASPLGMGGTSDEASLVGPAREGTLRVLAAATRAGVKRIVMTSSTAACTPPSDDIVGDERIWTDEKDPLLNAYRRSKVLSERAAWELMKTASGTTLTTILPGAVFGPVLSKDGLGSVQVIQRLLDGTPPGIANLGFAVVDVRDLADLHIRAMKAPEAAGERFVATSEFVWLADVAATLRASLGARAPKIPTRRLPDFALRILSWFVPSLRPVVHLLGRAQPFDSSKARRVLGFTPRPVAATAVDCAESLLPSIV